MITFKAKTASGEIIKSAISPFNFPAGEAFVKVEPQRDLEPTEIAILQPSAETLHDDLFHLAMWANYLRAKDSRTSLIIPYFPGARADRVSEGVEEPFGLEVYIDFINGLHLDQVIIFDPHSQKTPQMLKAWGNVTIMYSDDLFRQAEVGQQMLDYTGIIAPDKGAKLRAAAVAKTLGVPVYTAEKTRDPNTGKLSGFSIEGLPESTDEDDEFFLIVDDICDGGGTFLGLVDAIGLPYGKVDLFVSHGVFSKDALYHLKQKFEFVFTTNSYNPQRVLNDHGDFGDEDAVDTFERFDVIHLLLSKVL